MVCCSIQALDAKYDVSIEWFTGHEMSALRWIQFHDNGMRIT